MERGIQLPSPLDTCLVVAMIGEAQVLQAFLVLFRHLLRLLVLRMGNKLLEVRSHLLSGVRLGVISEALLDL